MSSIELRIAPVVSSRRREISSIDDQLRKLNLEFPGERKKPDAEKDPQYTAQRSGILERRQLLSGMQSRDRGILREVNG